MESLKKLLQLEINLIRPALIAIAVWLALTIIVATTKYIGYISGDYYLQTGNSRRKVRGDRGLSGEYFIYKRLKKLGGRFLFNLYLPKNDGTTTEIDAVMLHESGIYVFESKNYSGWIFGGEWQQNWTQTFPNRREHFLNPIIQNKVHIKWLKAALPGKSLPIHSFIVFGRDCKLKEIELTSGEHHIVTQKNLLREVKKTLRRAEFLLDADEIDEIYSALLNYSGVGRSVRKAHAEDVRRARRRARSWFWRLFR